MINNLPVLNVYKKKSQNSEITTQLLYGDKFKILKKNRSWIKIKNDKDNYIGYIKKKFFPNDIKNTHKISKIFAILYSKPQNKFKIKKKLSYGSKIKVSKSIGRFCRFDNFWIKKRDLKKIDYVSKNPFINVKKFINIKYKWGGKNFKGIDCSALIQVMMNFNNRFCPRDAKDQLRFFKKNIKLSKIKKNDLIFWKGHVAIAISKKYLVHAYGPYKKVVKMKIKDTIELIQKTSKLKTIGIKRI